MSDVPFTEMMSYGMYRLFNICLMPYSMILVFIGAFKINRKVLFHQEIKKLIDASTDKEKEVENE
jgi:hypothetical protein